MYSCELFTTNYMYVCMYVCMYVYVCVYVILHHSDVLLGQVLRQHRDVERGGRLVILVANGCSWNAT